MVHAIPDCGFDKLIVDDNVVIFDLRSLSSFFSVDGPGEGGPITICEVVSTRPQSRGRPIQLQNECARMTPGREPVRRYRKAAYQPKRVV